MATTTERPQVSPENIDKLRTAWKHQQQLEDQAFLRGDTRTETHCAGALAGIQTAVSLLLGIDRADAHAMLEGEDE